MVTLIINSPYVRRCEEGTFPDVAVSNLLEDCFGEEHPSQRRFVSFA